MTRGGVCKNSKRDCEQTRTSTRSREACCFPWGDRKADPSTPLRRPQNGGQYHARDNNSVRWQKLVQPALMAILVVMAGAHVFAQTPQEQLVQDAIEKQRAGDLQGAVSEYRNFLKRHPQAPPIHSNLGAALAGLGRFEEAVSEYKI